MMFPVIQILQKKFKKVQDNQFLGNVLRAVMVTITGLVVLLIPSFSNLMLVIGAGICSPLAFILPALFHLKIFGSTLSKKKKLLDYILIIIGIFASIIGGLDALKRIGFSSPQLPTPIPQNVTSL